MANARGLTHFIGVSHLSRHASGPVHVGWYEDERTSLGPHDEDVECLGVRECVRDAANQSA